MDNEKQKPEDAELDGAALPEPDLSHIDPEDEQGPENLQERAEWAKWRMEQYRRERENRTLLPKSPEPSETPPPETVFTPSPEQLPPLSESDLKQEVPDKDTTGDRRDTEVPPLQSPPPPGRKPIPQPGPASTQARSIPDHPDRPAGEKLPPPNVPPKIPPAVSELPSEIKTPAENTKLPIPEWSDSTTSFPPSETKPDALAEKREQPKENREQQERKAAKALPKPPLLSPEAAVRQQENMLGNLGLPQTQHTGAFSGNQQSSGELQEIKQKLDKVLRIVEGLRDNPNPSRFN